MKPGCWVGGAWIVFAIIALLIASEVGTACSLLTVLALMGGGFYVSDYVYRMNRESRVSEAESAQTRMARDRRPPVVYLRAFREDDTFRPLSVWLTPGSLISSMPFFGMGRQTVTFEEELASRLASVGPCVALAGRFPSGEAGAARIQATDATWQQTVEDLLKHCSLVVFRAGDTEALRWELGKIAEHVPPEFVLIFLQVGTETNVTVQEARYHQFAQKFKDIFPKPLPARRGKNEYLYFDQKWTPVLARKINQVFEHKDIPFERSSFRYSLKSKLPLARLGSGSWIEKQLTSQVSLNQQTGGGIRWLAFLLAAVMVGAAAGILHGALSALLQFVLLGAVSLIFSSVLAGLAIGLAGRILLLKGDRFFLVIGSLASLVFILVSAFVFVQVQVISIPLTLAIALEAIYEDIEFFMYWIIGSLFAITIICVLVWIYAISNYEIKRIRHGLGLSKG